MFDLLHETLLSGLPFIFVSALMLRAVDRRTAVLRLWLYALIPAALAAFLFLYTEYALQLELQINGILSGAALLAFLLILAVFLYSRYGIRQGELSTGEKAVCFTIFCLFAIAGLTMIFRPVLFLLWLSSESFGGIDQSLLERWFSFALALILLAAVGLAFYRSLEKATKREYFFIALPLFSILAGKVLLEFLFGLMALRLYQPNGFIFSLIVAHMNNFEASFFLLLGTAFVAGVVLKRLPRNSDIAATDNPAQKRKARAKRRREAKLITQGLACLLLLIIFGAAGSVITRLEQEIRPSTPIEMAAGGETVFYKSDLEDGHIHRYTWKSPGGVDIIFWLIKKREDNYGVVFDGCEICGPAGYLERGEDVVCIECDVVMNRNTIGLKGGCNPIPIENFTITAETIIVYAEDLLAQEDFFRNASSL